MAMEKKSKQLTAKERFCLDGYLANGNKVMAYVLSREKPTTADDEYILLKMAGRWLRGKEVQAYLVARRRELAHLQPSSDEEPTSSGRTKADIIKELNQLVDTTTDNKQKAQLLAQLAELQGYKAKPQPPQQEDSHVNYYLPMRCDFCPLYLQWQEYHERHADVTSDQLSEEQWDLLMNEAEEKAKQIAAQRREKARNDKE